MERFSNSSTELWAQLKLELQGDIELSDIRFRYLELGQRFTHGFSVALLKSSSDRIVIRKWNAGFDGHRFDRGIWNLDRLAVNEDVHLIGDEDRKEFEVLMNSNFALNTVDTIVLDGLYCRLEIDSQLFEWNVDEEMNSVLGGFIALLREQFIDIE